MMILKTDATWFFFWRLKLIGLQSPFDNDIQDINIKGANKKLKKVGKWWIRKMYFNITQQNFEHFFPQHFLSCSVFVIMSSKKKNTFSFIKYKSPIEGKCLKKEELGLCHVFYHYELGFFFVCVNIPKKFHYVFISHFFAQFIDWTVCNY